MSKESRDTFRKHGEMLNEERKSKIFHCCTNMFLTILEIIASNTFRSAEACCCSELFLCDITANCQQDNPEYGYLLCNNGSLMVSWYSAEIVMAILIITGVEGIGSQARKTWRLSGLMISDTNAGFYGFYGARGVHKRGGFLFFYEAGSANNKPGQKAVMTSLHNQWSTYLCF